jgi:hypothetical protein
MEHVCLASDAHESCKGRGHSFERCVGPTQRVHPPVDRQETAQGISLYGPVPVCISAPINKCANREFGRNASTFCAADAIGYGGDDY